MYFQTQINSNMTNIESEQLYLKALDKWGVGFQCQMAIEEMAELTKALCKRSRTKNESEVLKNFEEIIEEIADVEIMIEQLKLYFDPSKMLVNGQRIKKLEKLSKLLNK